MPESWFGPLTAIETEILAYDYRRALRDAGRTIVFWDAHGFDVAECVLGRILPEIAGREHLIVMHDLSDLRYASPDSMAYGQAGLWKGSDWSGPRLKIGHIDSAVEQTVAVLDFVTRNRLTLDSADHSFHRELAADPTYLAEMRDVLGDALFSLQGHWFYFSLN